MIMVTTYFVSRYNVTTDIDPPVPQSSIASSIKDADGSKPCLLCYAWVNTIRSYAVPISYKHTQTYLETNVIQTKTQKTNLEAVA